MPLRLIGVFEESQADLGLVATGSCKTPCNLHKQLVYNKHFKLLSTSVFPSTVKKNTMYFSSIKKTKKNSFKEKLKNKTFTHFFQIAIVF